MRDAMLGSTRHDRLRRPATSHLSDRPGLLGASVAVLALVGLSAWRGELDGAVLVVALAALVIGACLPARRHPAAAASDAEVVDRVGGPDVVGSCPDPIVLVDRRGLVVGANPASLAILPGLRLRSPLSLALRSPQVLDGLAQVMRTGAPLSVEFGGRIATEPTFEVRIRTLASIDNPAPAATAVAALFFRDLTEARRTERMRVDFIANVSHELRTPLASLIGFVETLQGPARDDAAARERFLAVMAVQAGRMKRLIDDLLQLSRVELNEHVAPSRPVDLAASVGHMVEVMAPLARERGVAIEADLPGEPVLVLGDRDEILRVAENLIENAIKYGGEGGRVEIGVRRLPQERPTPLVELWVRDHGPGIAAEHIPRLTERFYRVDTAQSRQQGGTGLGLAIVKHIVSRHRGRLTIESAPGGGTRVGIMLPEAPGGTASAA